MAYMRHMDIVVKEMLEEMSCSLRSGAQFGRSRGRKQSVQSIGAREEASRDRELC
jgi:hypothetical protein